MSNTRESSFTQARVMPQPQPLRIGRREFTRLLWKELFALRDFAGLLTAVLAVTCGVLWAWRPVLSEGTSLLLVSLPQMVAIVFAIGSGTLLFAQEDEAGTLDFLRGMGVSPRSLVNAKLMAGLVCLFVLVSLTAAIGWQSPATPDLESSNLMISVSSFGAGLVVLLWTSLWSMTLRRELPTVCCGVLGVLLLKPFVEGLQEIGLLLVFVVVASGEWLLCQVVASRWIGTGNWRFWISGKSPAAEDQPVHVGDFKSFLATHFVGESRRFRITVGSVMLLGILSLLLRMTLLPRSSTVAQPEAIQLKWTLLVCALLGWWPVRLERRAAQPQALGNWRQRLESGSIPWLLLWWLLSLVLLPAYRADDSSFGVELSLVLRFFRDAVLPWSIVTFGSLRLMARLCAGRWLAWPLSVVPLGISWSVWWLLVMFGEPAWMGLLILGASFHAASWWQWRVTQWGRPMWQANLSAAAGPIVCLVLLLGFLNWWRVAEIPNDWTGGVKIEPRPALTAAEERQLAGQRSRLYALAEMVSPAPMTRMPDGKEMPCFNDDWLAIDGTGSWSNMTEATRRWVESNETAIRAALNWQNHSPENNTESTSPDVPAEFDQPPAVSFWTNAGSSRAQFVWLLAARRCEEAGELDDAWRLHRLVFEADRKLLTREPSQYYHYVIRQFWDYERLAVWVGHPQQTSVRLRQAIADLLSDGENALPPEVMLSSEFQRFRDAHRGSAETDRDALGNWSWEGWLLSRLCPAESQREQRVIDGLEAAHQVAFAELRPLTRKLSASWKQPAGESQSSVGAFRPTWLIPQSPKFIGVGIPWVRGSAVELIAKTPRLNFPKREPSSSRQWEAITGFRSTEDQRRAHLLFMAQRAFELDHQRPPKSADELVPAYLPQRPVAVFSGEDMWAVSQRPREQPTPPDVTPTNSQDATPGVPAIPPAMQHFHWRSLVRDNLQETHLEISLTNTPRLIFVSY